MNLSDASVTIRSLQPLRDVLSDRPALLDTIQQRFHFSLNNYHASLSLANFKSLLLYLRGQGLPDIGYRFGWSIDVGTFGFVDYYLHSSPTLREALVEFIRICPLMARDVAVQLELQNDVFTLCVPDFNLRDDGELIRLQALATMLVRYIQLLMHDNALLPTKTETPISAAQAIAEHTQFMGPTIVYGCDHFSISYPVALLDLPLRNSNAVVRKALRPEIEQALNQARTEATTQQKLLDWLLSLPEPSRATQGLFADDLGISESSLKRRLAEEKTSFTEVLNSFRRCETLRLLADESNKIDYIARVLGFSERSAFERAFRQWFTITPAQFRFETVQCKLQSQPGGHALDKLPPLPKIAQEIITLMQQDDFDMRQLVALLQKEPVLSARLLGLANSAYYGAGRVTTLSDAVQRVLGVDTVRNLVLVSMCSEPFKAVKARLFNRTQHWVMAFSVAQLAQALAKTQTHNAAISVDAVQLLGLMHNLGALLLAYTRPHDMDLVLAQSDAVSGESEWPALEMRGMGINRYIAAAVLLTHWRLPPDLCRRIRALSDAALGSDDAVVNLVYQVIYFVGEFWRLKTHTGFGLTEDKQEQLHVDYFVHQLAEGWQTDEAVLRAVVQTWRHGLTQVNQTAEMMSAS